MGPINIRDIENLYKFLAVSFDDNKLLKEITRLCRFYDPLIES